MNTEQVIAKLKASNLYAECNCGDEFKLSKALMFDGTKPFPEKALKAQVILKEDLELQEKELIKRIKNITEKIPILTQAVNIGKNFEKILPTMKDFKLDLPDCRFMNDPIDLITFNGLTKGKVNSINFIEVKSGKARLNDHQKSVKDAIEDKKVFYKVF